MICARCDRPIEEGQLYHAVKLRGDDDGDQLAVHDRLCPEGVSQ